MGTLLKFQEETYGSFILPELKTLGSKKISIILLMNTNFYLIKDDISFSFNLEDLMFYSHKKSIF